MRVDIEEMPKVPVPKNGVVLRVRDPQGKQKGRLVIYKSGLEWLDPNGKMGNGYWIEWDDFINWMTQEE